jgi:hypothetical protein
MDREEEILEKAVVVLNAKLTGVVLGVLFGFGLFLATIILVVKGGTNVGEHLGLLRNYFPGYRVTYLGSLVGFLYGFATGFWVGWVIGTVYNKVAKVL